MKQLIKIVWGFLFLITAFYTYWAYQMDPFKEKEIIERKEFNPDNIQFCFTSQMGSGSDISYIHYLTIGHVTLESIDYEELVLYAKAYVKKTSTETPIENITFFANCDYYSISNNYLDWERIKKTTYLDMWLNYSTRLEKYSIDRLRPKWKGNPINKDLKHLEYLFNKD